VYSAGSLAALFLAFSTALIVYASLFTLFFVLNDYAAFGMDPIAAYLPFLYYSCILILGYGALGLILGGRVLQFAITRKESVLSTAVSIVLGGLIFLTYVRFGFSLYWLNPWNDFATIVVIAPIAEEVFYRMFFLTVLVKATQQPTLSLIFDSLLFALAHLSAPGGPSIVLLVGAIPFSIAVGLAFLYTRRLSVPVGMHFAVNAVGFLFGYLV
jgi:membrane protease YdiL (CAAX protease family)